MINFSIRSSYNFDVYPSALIGSEFKGVTILSIMDAESANKEIDIQAMHVQVYPHLPAGSPNDPYSYNYVKIKTMSGQTMILGLAWIKEETVALNTSSTIVATITGVTTMDVQRISNALLQNGYSQFSIKVQ